MRFDIKSNTFKIIARKLFSVLSVIVFVLSINYRVYASEDTGTFGVVYAPIYSNGKITGCSLIYKSVFLDHIHKQGNPVILDGNISLLVFLEQKSITLTYKLGLRDIKKNAVSNPYPPYFMYLKTSKHTTAESLYVPNDSDLNGYRIYSLQLDQNVLGVIDDMLEEQKVIIGYNLSKNGLDTSVEVDLTVKDTSIINGEMKRVYSSEAINQYGTCIIELINQFK